MTNPYFITNDARYDVIRGAIAAYNANEKIIELEIKKEREEITAAIRWTHSREITNSGAYWIKKQTRDDVSRLGEFDVVRGSKVFIISGNKGDRTLRFVGESNGLGSSWTLIKEESVHLGREYYPISEESYNDLVDGIVPTYMRF